MNRITLLLALALAAIPEIVTGRLLIAQDPPATAPAPKTPANEIFSGTVAELNPDSVVVIRTALAREPVKRTFILDAQTVVEGKLRAKARVSVRYTADENGQFHALHIIVR